MVNVLPSLSSRDSEILIFKGYVGVFWCCVFKYVLPMESCDASHGCAKNPEGASRSPRASWLAHPRYLAETGVCAWLIP